MTVTTKSRLALVALAASTLALTACAPSIPPGSEVADELIDSQKDLTDGEKQCLHDKVANFSVPVAAGTEWKTIDDVADAADSASDKQKKAQAQAIIDDFFTKAFADCDGATAANTATDTAAGQG